MEDARAITADGSGEVRMSGSCRYGEDVQSTNLYCSRHGQVVVGIARSRRATSGRIVEMGQRRRAAETLLLPERSKWRAMDEVRWRLWVVDGESPPGSEKP